nr:retrovirus-related Pol polyprotein from transposon TNT 1-94 [Tanacetum cinerariifolium]
MNPWGENAAGYGEAQNRVGNVNQGQARPGQARTMKCYNCNGTGHIARNCTQPKRPQNFEYFKDKMLLMQAQENGVTLDAEQLLFLAGGQDNVFDDDVDEQPIEDLALNVDNVFQAEDCDAFDSDVDEAPTAQTMFMANLSLFVFDDMSIRKSHVSNMPFRKKPRDSLNMRSKKKFLGTVRFGNNDFAVIAGYGDVDAGISMNLLQELMDTCTALTRRVEHLELDKIAQALEITKLKQMVKKLERRNKLKDVVLEDAKDGQDADVEENANIQGRRAERKNQSQLTLQEVVDVVTTAKIITEVVTAASTTITAVDMPFPTATNVAAPKLTTAPSRRTKGVVIRDPEESTTTFIIIHSEAKSKDKELEAELNRTIDWDKVIDHVNKKSKEDNVVKRYQAIKRKPQTEAQARKNMMIYQKNVAGFKMDNFKGMSYDDTRLVFEKYFESNVSFLQNTKEQMDEEDSRALKRLNESKEEKVAKKQKYTCSNLEKSKKCSWSSKSQELEAVGILWCADNYIYNNTVDFASRKEISTHKVHSGLNVK